jgi:pimeloyl-ACP methyl ester carboxylesterase
MGASQIRKAYLDTKYGQLHYRYAVPSDPPRDIIVFLHQSATSGASMTRLMDHYASRGYACYAPDMPGFGQSDDPPDFAVEEISALGTRWYVNLYLRAFAQLGVAKYHIVGHHTGASLATEMAAVRPEAVKSICLIGTSVMTAAERAEMKARFFEPFNKPTPDGSHLQKTWDYVAKLGGDGDLEVHQQAALDHIRAWKGRNQIYGAIWDQDKEKYMKDVSCPAIAMCAEDDVLWPYFQHIRRVRDDISMVEIKGAAYSPELDVEGVIAACTPTIESAI